MSNGSEASIDRECSLSEGTNSTDNWKKMKILKITKLEINHKTKKILMKSWYLKE